ncbi:MAG: hypothetical protein K6B44_08740 [Lachnospiraceae bacterium]|nr:hypothetical protein [Lachnospiraceae bacterium]
MAKKHGSHRKNSNILKAVIIIVAASLILAVITTAVFLGLGKNAGNAETTAVAEETAALTTSAEESSAEAVREVVSLELPGTDTESSASDEAGTENTSENMEESSADDTEENAEKSTGDTVVENPEENAEDSTENTAEDNPADGSESPPEENATDNTNEDSANDPADTSAPCFLSFTNSPIIKAGDVFDIHKFIGYADDVDRDVQITINGEIDSSTIGKYPLEIVLSDDAGHTVSRNMEVNVVAEIPPSIPTEKKTEAFSDFLAAYKTEQTSVGIDVSRWQETIDFEKVKAAGCEFAYIRIGGLDDGELYTDRYYLNNIRNAKAAGLKVGIYWHAEEGSAAEVKASTAYLLNVLSGEQLDFPIAYDWEDFKNFENYGMNLKDINDNASLFASELAKAGYPACLYSSKFFLENVWSSVSTPVWLAHYTKATSYPGPYFIWQHSCTGKIDGIAGDVDLDVLYINKL